MRRALLFCMIVLVGGCVLAADLLSMKDLPEGRWATPEAPSRRTALADSLRLSIPAGETLIADLPDSLKGRAVAEYRILRAPALSWATAHSFFWQTRPEDAGTHRLLYEARFAAAPPDTLSVFVTVD